MSVSYRYRAARADGTIERGQIQVATREAAAAYLGERQLLPIDLEAATDATNGRAIPHGELAVGLRTLSTLLDSGLPLNRALAAFEDVAPPRWKPIVPGIREQVRQGRTLAQAFDRSGGAVPELMVGIIHAADSGSGQAASAARAADIAEASAQLRSAIRSALAYPALLAAVGTISIAVVLGVVLPRFSGIIADLGTETPPLARIAIAVGDLAALSIWPLLVLAMVTPLVWRQLISDSATRRKVHALLLRLPVTGSLRIATASSRTCFALSAALQSGVPIASALQLASRTTGDDEMSARLLHARDRVISGGLLSAALAEDACITPTARRLVRAGEESGRLADMLQRAAALDVQAVSARVGTLVRLIEPTLIVTFAGIIALVAAALLQAVYAVRPI